MPEYSNNRESYLKLWEEIQNDESQLDNVKEEAAPAAEPKAEKAEAGFDEIAVKHELIEDMVKETTEEAVVEEQEVLASEDAITFSNKIINILENKAKIHNSKYDNKVTLDELKEVYMNGSDSYETLDESVVPGWKGRLQLKSNWPVWAMSRVNMFLRMKRSEKMEAQQTKNESSASELDVAVSLVPSEKCIEEAIEDMVGENVGDIGDLQPSDVYIESKAQALEFSTSLSLLNRLN
tara:strand:- start:4727 stop:5437 length:711 start_codon:yes stop_codon:yes gene_type:complete